MTDEGWIDTGEEVAIRYGPAGTLDDGTEVFVADGPVPEGIPVETHVIGGIQVKAIYADGFIDDDRYPHPRSANGGSCLRGGGSVSYLKTIKARKSLEIDLPM